MNISDLEGRAVKLSDDTINRWIEGMQRFPIVTMCGSTKFKEEYLKSIEDLTYWGSLVLFCPIFHHADGIKIPEDKVKMIRDIHMQRIRMCDGIFVVNKDGYIGNSTKEEIEYATSIGKDVWYMEPIKK